MITARNARVGLAALLLACLVCGLATALRLPAAVNRIHVVAYFPNSNGVYIGDEVRILGVPVGKIDSIEPQPLRVKISFWYDGKHKVPADAKAAVLSPSLVTSRAIQLTPAYTTGAAMRDNAVIPEERTVVPVEWDDLRAQLHKLTDSLQPSQPGGVSTLGAFVNTAADNLRGQGANIHDTVVKLSQALSALGDHSTDIFSTVRNLSVLVSALHNSADLMKLLNQNFAAVTALLARDPNAIGQAVHDLNAAVEDVKTFVADNRDALGTTSDKLAGISTALTESLDDIKQALHVAPNTLQNVINIYEPAHAALVGTPALNNFSNPITFLCGAIQAASRLNAKQAAKLCVQYLAPIVKNRQFNFPPLGENFIVGPKVRPNEVTYSEDWLRPDHVPPAPTPPDGPGTAGPPAGATDPVSSGPRAAEAPAGEAPATPVVTTNPADGLPGMMVPAGGRS